MAVMGEGGASSQALPSPFSSFLNYYLLHRQNSVDEYIKIPLLKLQSQGCILPAGICINTQPLI